MGKVDRSPEFFWPVVIQLIGAGMYGLSDDADGIRLGLALFLLGTSWLFARVIWYRPDGKG